MHRVRHGAPMTGVDPKTFAARVAAECSLSAERLLDLQATIGSELDGSSITPRLLADIQALDAVYQTLTDLGHVFARLSLPGLASCGPAGIPLASLGDARQTTLRGRLIGEEATPEGDGIDLF